MSIQLNEHGFKADYQPVEATVFEAAQGAALWRSAEFQEQLGREMYLTGNPISLCPTRAAMRGWELAQQADLDSQTLEEQIEWQIERNAAVLAQNAEALR